MKLNKGNQIKNGVGRPEWGALIFHNWSSTVDPKRKRGALLSQLEEAYFTAQQEARGIFPWPAASSANRKILQLAQ